MKHKFKRGLSLILACAMVLTLLPAAALAAGDEDTEVSSVSTEAKSPVQITKTVTPNSDGTYKLTMEAYVTKDVTVSTSTVPMDIVLVLDQSGSMRKTFNDNSTTSENEMRITALKNAVTSFVSAVQKNAAENSIDHKIAIVGFASNSTSYKNTELLSTEDEVNYSNAQPADYQAALVSANDNGSVNDRLTTAIDRVDAEGQTYASLGLEMAQEVLENRTEDASGENQNRKTVVIFFTDGYPGQTSITDHNFYEATSNSSYDYDNISAANAAIDQANELKKNGVTIYSVGIFPGANPAASYNFFRDNGKGYFAYKNAYQAANAYMHFVSSDYDAVESSTPNMETYRRNQVVNNGYYLAASSADELSSVFSQIQSSISSGTVDAGSDSVLSDTLSDMFDFGDGVVDANGQVTGVTVQTADVNGKDADGNYTWDDPTAATGVNVTIDENKTIKVTGFNYSDNAVTTTTNGGNTTYSGKKLVISFNIKPDTDYAGWTDASRYDTNTAASLTYGENETTELTASPVAPVTTYTVTYSWGNVDVEVECPKDTQHYIADQTARVKNDIQSGAVITASDGTQYRFNGWTNNGATVAAGDSIAISGNVTLTADLAQAYTVTYTNDDPDVTGDPPTDPQSPYTADTDVTVLSERGSLTKTGYTFTGWTTSDATVANGTFTMPSQNVTFVPEWTVNQYTVTIYYVYEDGTSAAETRTITDDYGKAYSVSSPKIAGYTASQEIVSGTIPVGGTNITVTYTRDDDQKNALTYTVKHVTVLNEMETEKDSTTYTESVWAGETNPRIKIQDGSLNEKTYVGYNFAYATVNGEETDLSTVTAVADKTVIILYYEKDESQTQDTKYTVHYTIEGAERTDDKIEVTGTAWINDDLAQIEIAEGGIPTPDDKYTGYKLDPANPEYPAAGSWVDSGSEYTVNYVKDDSQTQPTNYTVKHVVDGVEKTDDTQTYSGTAWINDTNPTITIINGTVKPNTYEGYKYVSTSPDVDDDDEVASGTMITLTYVKDDEQVKTVKYTVTYMVDNEQNGLTLTYTDSVWVNDSDEIKIQDGTIDHPDNKFIGYKFDHLTVDGETNNDLKAGNTVSDNAKIVIYYEKDETWTQNTSYTVKHVVDGVEQTEDTQTYDSTAWINDDPAMIKIESGSLDANSYIGYKLDSIQDENGNTVQEGDEVLNGTVITLTYEPDYTVTQNTSYTVTHVLVPRVGENQVLAGPTTYNSTDWVNELNPTAVVTADSIAQAANVPEGYTYSGISPEGTEAGSEVANGTAIILYYTDNNYGRYSVTYTGEAITDVTTYHAPDAQISIVPDPVREGYLFDGWVCDQDDKIYQAGDTYTVTADVVFTAQWTPIVREVELQKELTLVNGEEYVAGSTVNTGDILTYSITVVNKGNVDLPVVVVTDSLVGSFTFQNVPANDADGVTATYTYQVPADKTGVLTNTATVDDETIDDKGGDEVSVEITARYTVTTFIDKHGEITPTTTYNAGENAAVYFTGDRDYAIKSVTVDGVRTNSYGWDKNERAYVITFPGIDADHTVVVTTTYDGYYDYVPSKPELNIEDHVAYIVGYEDGTVRPQNEITRAEVATIFFRLLTDESRAYFWSQTNPFSDVVETAWYNNAVSTLNEAGIIVDSANGFFRPNEAITRAEFAVMAAQFTGLTTDKLSSFKDVPANHWAAYEIALVEQQGWIEGYGDGTFHPDDTITRAEAMTIINRMLERAVQEDHMLRGMVTWIDNQPGTWYYETVQEATNSHSYTRLSVKVSGQSYCYEDWRELLENPDWAALENIWSTANSK